MSNKHSSGLFPFEHRGLWEMLTLTMGVTALLCWWVAIVAIANSRSAGSAVFLLVPVLATAATFVSKLHASRRRSGSSLP